MGKVRRQRQKFHLVNKSKSKSTENLAEKENPDASTENNLSFSELSQSTPNIFAGIDISFEDINKSLPVDFDTRSVVSTKSRKELKEEEQHLTKKEKLKLRHDRFLSKINFTQQQLKALKEKHKKKKKGLPTSPSTVPESLPTLQSLTVGSKKRFEAVKPPKKIKGTLKVKERLKQHAKDAQMFKTILNDQTFQLNPAQAITEFLKQKMENER